MSSFDGLALFESGPHRFEVGGVALRHVLNETPGGRGVRLSALGQHSRVIRQTGWLVADDVGRLGALIEAVEEKVDGQGYELVDDVGRVWAGVVMVKFEPGGVGRVGARWGVEYKIEYLQVEP